MCNWAGVRDQRRTQTQWWRGLKQFVSSHALLGPIGRLQLGSGSSVWTLSSCDQLLQLIWHFTEQQRSPQGTAKSCSVFQLEIGVGDLQHAGCLFLFILINICIWRVLWHLDTIMLFVFHHFSQMSVTYDWLNFGSEVITRPVTVAGTDSRGEGSFWLVAF